MDPVGSTSRATISGLATGLDTGAIVQGLLDIERQPLNRMEARRETVSQQRGLIQDLNTKLLALRNAARDIDNRTSTGTGPASDEELLRYSVSTTDEDKVSATATGGATPQSIELEVVQLATSARQFSQATASQTAPVLNAGETFTVTFADPAATSFTVTAGTGGLSLQGLRSAINTAAGNDDLLRADVVFDGVSSYRMVLSSAETGSESNFTVSGDFASQVDPPLSQSAQNAQVLLYGGAISIDSATNEISDAVPGVTLQLRGVRDAPGDRETLDIEVDVDGVAENLEKFVDAYNDVISFIGRQLEVDPETNRAGPLGNDSTIRNVQSQLLRAISDQFLLGPNNPFQGIGNIGLDLDSGGALSVDRDALADALTQNANALAEFVSGVDTVDVQGNPVFSEGLASRFASMLDPIVRFGDGLLATRDQGFQERIDSIDQSIDAFERRLSQREETLVARFTRLELVVSGLQAQSFFLGSLR